MFPGGQSSNFLSRPHSAPHSTRFSAGALRPATSCLDAFWTPAGCVCGKPWRCRRPKTCTVPAVRCLIRLHVAGDLLSAAAPQRYLPQDTDVLRTLVRHHKVQLGRVGAIPLRQRLCRGRRTGTVRTLVHRTLVHQFFGTAHMRGIPARWADIYSLVQSFGERGGFNHGGSPGG